MSNLSFTGNDSIVGSTSFAPAWVFKYFPFGVVFDVTFPNDVWKVHVGKNGNTVYAYDNSGGMAKGVIRVMKGSADDGFLESLVAISAIDPPSTQALTIYIVKRYGGGSISQAFEEVICQNGVISKLVPVKSDADGDPEQSVATYEMIFSGVTRLIA
jgi:hypothetical protein